MQTHATYPSETAQGKPWYAHRWPWLLMLGPLLVVLAGIHTAWLAFSGQDALVVDDYYKQGKAINQDLRRDRIAASLRIALHMRYDAATGKLTGSVSRLNQPMSGEVAVRLIHPTQPAKDMQLEARADEQGNFLIELPMLERARWQVLVEGENREWRLNGKWFWPEQKSVDIEAA